MRALTWHGKRDVRVETVPDPAVREPTDVIVRVTSSGICGSDLHLYEVMGAFMGEGDVLGHEPMGVVEEVGPDVTELAAGDRVVVPFNISCGACFMCGQGLYSQCETTQVREHGTGAALFGYTKLYGEVPGGQAEYLRVPFGNTLPIRVPDGPPDDRFVFLSDVLPTAWQAVEYAAVPDGGSVVVLGLGPIGDMCTRIAQHRGYRAIGIDLVPERLERVRARGVEVLDLLEHEDDLVDVVRGLTDGRGPDSVIDAVGMEAHGSPVTKVVHTVTSYLPDALQARLIERAGSTGCTRSTSRSSSSAAAARSRSAASTAAWPTRCRCASSSTSRSSCGWARRTCCAGCRRSCRSCSTATRSASTPSRATTCRSSRDPRPTRSSSASRTAS
jgi:threonine dehydrogenase-like Zn-dependent dehydrogenase